MTDLRQIFLALITIICLGGISHAGLMVGVDHLEISSSVQVEDGRPIESNDSAYAHNAQQGCGIVPPNNPYSSVPLGVMLDPTLGYEIPDVVDHVAQAEFSPPPVPVLDGLIRPA